MAAVRKTVDGRSLPSGAPARRAEPCHDAAMAARPRSATMPSPRPESVPRTAASFRIGHNEGPTNGSVAEELDGPAEDVAQRPLVGDGQRGDRPRRLAHDLEHLAAQLDPGGREREGLHSAVAFGAPELDQAPRLEPV